MQGCTVLPGGLSNVNIGVQWHAVCDTERTCVPQYAGYNQETRKNDRQPISPSRLRNWRYKFDNTATIQYTRTWWFHQGDVTLGAQHRRENERRERVLFE